jgi:peptidoglycan/LPS O-acetylase OafA/YrhL
MSGKWFYRKWKTTNGKVNVYEYYLARLLKIAPIYYLVFWFYLITINKLIVGRFKEEIVENICSKNWILNILFLFNFISSEEMVSELVCDQEMKNKKSFLQLQCMPWTYFNAVLIQLILISPLFLIVLMRYKVLKIPSILLEIQDFRANDQKLYSILL